MFILQGPCSFSLAHPSRSSCPCSTSALSASFIPASSSSLPLPFPVPVCWVPQSRTLSYLLHSFQQQLMSLIGPKLLLAPSKHADNQTFDPRFSPCTCPCPCRDGDPRATRLQQHPLHSGRALLLLDRELPVWGERRPLKKNKIKAYFALRSSSNREEGRHLWARPCVAQGDATGTACCHLLPAQRAFLWAASRPHGDTKSLLSPSTCQCPKLSGFIKKQGKGRQDTNEPPSLINPHSCGKFEAARAPRQKIKKLIKSSVWGHWHQVSFTSRDT